MHRLQNKVALVTGGATGLGAVQTRSLVQEGARVVVGDIRDVIGEALEQELRAAGGDAFYMHLDVTREDDWIRAGAATVERYGKLDGLVNNAGITISRVAIEERTVEEWDRVMAVNVRGVFLGTKHVTPEMRRAGGGSIINSFSLAVIGQSSFQEPAYATQQGRRATL